MYYTLSINCMEEQPDMPAASFQYLKCNNFISNSVSVVNFSPLDSIFHCRLKAAVSCI